MGKADRTFITGTLAIDLKCVYDTTLVCLVYIHSVVMLLCVFENLAVSPYRASIWHHSTWDAGLPSSALDRSVRQI